MTALIWKLTGHLACFLYEIAWRLCCCAIFLLMALSALVCPRIVGGVLGKVLAGMMEE